MSLRVEVVTVTPFQQNCSVIWCSETMQGAVVDPGGDVENIISKINQHEVKVAQILLTHGHLDHAGGAAKLKRELDIPVIGPHKGDDFWLQGIEKQAANYGFPGAENCSPDQWLNDGKPHTVSARGGAEVIGSKDLTVIHHESHKFLSTMILDGVLETYPKLMGGIIEIGAGWVPDMLRRLDHAVAIWSKLRLLL